MPSTPRWIRALLVASVTTLAAAGAQDEAHAQGQPSAADVKKATTHFEKGSTFFEAKKYALALEQFKISYATVASPNSHLFMARCLAQLGETRDAYIEFDKVVAEADARAKTEPKYAPARDSAKTERDELAPKLALVTVIVKGADPAAKVKIGAIEVPASDVGKPVPVMPGPADVYLEGQPGAPVKQSLTFAAGDRKEVVLDATPATPPPAATAGASVGGSGSADSTPRPDNPKLRMYSYIAGGVGAAGLVLFTVAGLMANSTYSDLEESCKGPCPSDREDDISSGRTEQTLANVGLVVGVLGIGAGVTLFILSRGSGDAKTGAAPTGSTAVLVGPRFTGVRGTF